MKLWILLIAFLVASCDRQSPVQQGSPNEGKALQSAGGASSDEGKSIRGRSPK
jgi:hypothetical protein